MIFVREGVICHDIKGRLQRLLPGRRAIFYDLPPKLPWDYVRGSAESLHYWVSPHSRDAYVEVFNLEGGLEEFAKGVRDLLSELAVGEVVNMPPQGILNEAQMAVIQECADQLGYPYMLVQPGDSAPFLQIGNLEAFATRVRRDLLMLEDDGERRYGGASDRLGSVEGLTNVEESIVSKIALEYGCHAEGILETQRHTMKVVKPQTQPKPSTEQDEDLHAEDDLRESLGEVFGQYCTGKHSILRKADVYRFVQDTCKARKLGKEKFAFYLSHVETAFDDTLELQEDTGSRFTHGLERTYFQVFMSKASTSFGASLAGLVRSLCRIHEAESQISANNNDGHATMT